jgi:sulfur-oxidizing protein SoxA
MKQVLVLAVGLAVLPSAPATPQEDLQQFQAYFKARFPDVPADEFVNGVYAIDQALREQWRAIEQFPPYDFAVEEGERLFRTPLRNGKAYADCFPGWEQGIRQNYPYFDLARGTVVTLEYAINECRKENGEEPLRADRGSMASITAFLSHRSRGKRFAIQVPDDPRAVAAYEQGKRLFFARLGQLNMSCANCHVDYAGRRLRAEVMSPALGHPTHWPVYRSRWGDVGTLHWRFEGCMEQVRAEPFALQSEPFRNLEYYLTYMSNGLPVSGPATRR